MVGVHGLPMTDVGAPSARIRTGPARQHLTWLGAGFVVGFAVPFLFTDVVQLPRDLYYGVYIATVLVFFGLWARATGQRLDLMVRRHWRWAVVLGVVVAAALGVVVLRTEPATAGPTGLTLSAAVLWRGVAYGAVDGLLLSAFPILAVFAASEGSKVAFRPAASLRS